MAPRHDALKEHLRDRLAIWDPARLDVLPERKRAEVEFHNLDRERTVEAQRTRDEVALHANRKWYDVAESSRQYVERWLAAESPGSVFLDYACGDGLTAIRAAECGSSLSIGLDLSDVSIRNARADAEARSVSKNCIFIQGDCEHTELPDASIDRVVCSGMLHHLELDAAYRELRRILRPGGKILCIEALRHNPLIGWYRSRTPHMRTEWESQHILGVEALREAQRYFAIGDVRYWHLCSLGTVPFRRTPIFRPLLALTDTADRLLLHLPGIRRLAWQFSFELLYPVRTVETVATHAEDSMTRPVERTGGMWATTSKVLTVRS